MKWKIFITAFISLIATGFPANIIGCGPEADPYDYYVSFFNQELPEAKSFRPFYFSRNVFLYDTEELPRRDSLLAQEWAGYCNMPVTKEDAYDFVFAYGFQYLDTLCNKIKSKKRTKHSVVQPVNSMEKYFLKSKDVESLKYILFARKTEPYVLGNDWEAISRDSTAMDSLVQQGLQLFRKAKKDFIKLKYGYQVVRLCHYNRRYEDAIRFYDEYISGNNTNSILQPLSIALKAGALYHIGKYEEAAYLFSRAFDGNNFYRISNYISFKWCTAFDKATKDSCLALCKTNKERAGLLILYALGSTQNEVPSLKEIYSIDPGSEALEVLLVREINKLEELYFTPEIKKHPGGVIFYSEWYNEADENMESKKMQAKELADFLHNAARTDNVFNRGLFETGAAYTYMMAGDFARAHQAASAAHKLMLSSKLKDQLQLTELLLTINETDKIDAAFEEKFLPSLQWLYQKAQSKVEEKEGLTGNPEWRYFFRDLMSQVIAKRYHAQSEVHKELLAIAAAERVYGSNYQTYNFLHNDLSSKDVILLYEFFINKHKTAYDDYLISFNNFSKEDVINFAGTVYLREYNYAKAIEWFKKVDNKDNLIIGTNPFIDLLYDQEAAFENEKSTTKLEFAEEMLRFEKLAAKDKRNAGRYYYKMALGMYNMTYYGHAWQLTQYDRSGNEFEYEKDEYFLTANTFQKEYYGCLKAHDYFKKAMDAGVDKNFKARCLFMMAKCSQKLVQHDSEKFVNNKYFPLFIKEYGNTTFYREAFNSCSYLRDFVEKKK